MFEILIKLMNEIRANIGSRLLENNFNLGLMNVEEEIERLAQIPACTIEAIRSEVKHFTDALVYSSAHDTEHFFDEQKQLLTIRINTLLQALSEPKKASSLSLEASSQHSAPAVAVSISNTTPDMISSENDKWLGSAMKKAGGNQSQGTLRRQRRYPIDLENLHVSKLSSLNASNNSDYSSSKDAFLSTPVFLPLTDQQRQEMQVIFSCIGEILQANNLEGMIEIGPMFAEQILDILEACMHKNSAYEIFISRMINIQRQAFTEDASLLHLFIDNFKAKMQNSSNSSTLHIKIPPRAVYTEEGLSDWGNQSSSFKKHSDFREREQYQKRRESSSSSSMKQAISASVAFYRPGPPRENGLMTTIQALDTSIFDDWIKPLRSLLDIYAPPTNYAVVGPSSSAAIGTEANTDDIETNFSAQYLSFLIYQLESIHNGSLVIDSVSDLDDLMVSICNNFHDTLPKQINRDQIYLIDAEIFGELGDSIVSDALMTFKLQAEESMIARQFY